MSHQQLSPDQNMVTGLASCHSYLDGVPFKISPVFRPLPQPGFPTELLSCSAPCEALSDEYYYETEEAVLAWARARDEAKAKAVAERERARAAAAVAAAQSSCSSDSEDEAPEPPEQSYMNTAQSSELSQLQPPPRGARPPWQMPSVTSVGSTILTPTPIQTNSETVPAPSVPKTHVDLALFEQEGDPFDNLELQTIDDMAELRTVLDARSGAPASQQSSSRNDQAGEGSNDVNASNIAESAGASLTTSSADNIYVNVGQNPSDATICSREQTIRSLNDEPEYVNSVSQDVASVSGNVFQPALPSPGYVIEPTGAGDYVQIRLDHLQLTPNAQTDSDLAPVYANLCPGAETAQQNNDASDVEYVNCESCQQAVPPVQPRVQSLGHDAVVSAAGKSGSTAITATPKAPSQSDGQFHLPTGQNIQNSSVASASASGVQSSCASDASAASDVMYSNIASGGEKSTTSMFLNSFYGCFQGPSPGSPISTNSVNPRKATLRNVSSNPDMSATVTPQPWNPSKPLPPTPVSEVRSSSSSTESIPSDHGRTPSPLVSSPSPSPSECNAAGSTMSGEVDPYHSLPSDARVLVDNLTSMGFSRSRASRAVEKFGADEREVLDHMFHVDKLVEKKFAPALAETGLQLFKNDIQKAEQFLDLFQQFSELGFTSDRIQTALVRHQLDRDKALDYLTT